MLFFALPLIVFADHEPGHSSGGDSKTACEKIIISNGFGQKEISGARIKCEENDDCYVGKSHGSEFSHPVCRTRVEAALKNEASQAIAGLIYKVVVEPLVWVFAWLGGSFLKVVLNPNIYAAIFSSQDGNDLMYSMWKLVRNLLNVMFIFVLLLSAFATIFQVQKWHLKQILVKVIIMALLVNFSWPITRVFIDAGNVLMYGILELQVTAENTTGSDNIIGLIYAESDVIKNLLKDPSADGGEVITITDVLIRGVFMLLFVMTFLTLAILFLLRIVMFVLLLIFSPVGFVAAIFPGTQKFASMWWEALLKWTFIGPILVLMLFVALSFITKMKGALDTVGKGIGSTGGTGLADFGGTMILYTAAMAILWAGIMAANQIGGKLASVAMKRTNQLGSWSARKTWNGLRRGGRAADNLSVVAQKRAIGGRSVSVAGGLGRIRGIGKGVGAASRRTDTIYGQRKQAGAAAAASKTGDKHAVANYNKKEKTRLKDEEFKHASTDQVIAYANNDSNKLQQEAAREHISTQKDTIKDPAMLVKALNAMGDDVEGAAKLIANATTPGAFSGVTTADYGALRSSVAASGMSVVAQDRVQGDIDKKYTENKNVHVLVDHDVSSRGISRRDAIDQRLNISNADAAKQNKLWEGIGTDRDLQNYATDNYAANPQTHQDVFKQMTPKARAEMTDVGLNP